MELLNYLFCDMFRGILECYELTHVLPLTRPHQRQSCMSGQALLHHWLCKCGVTLMRRLSRVWVRGGWPAHAQCAYVEPREIQPRGALSCSDCQGRQAWFCRSADLQRAGLLAQVLGQRELAIATIRSSVEVPGSVCDVPGVPCEDRWFDGRKQQHARWQWGQCFI